MDKILIVILKGGNSMDKETLKMFSELLDSKLGALENRLDDKIGALENRLDAKLDKNTMLLENLTSKVETIAEVQKSYMEQNEKAHNEMVKILNEKIDVIELAVKDTSNDVKEIQENLEPLCEDMIVVKSVVKIISNDIVDLSDKIEFIGLKEFDNERELFIIKKKLTQ
jgi:prophage DNA circulation protein